jgi:hypothetical protein
MNCCAKLIQEQRRPGSKDWKARMVKNENFFREGISRNKESFKRA